MVEHPTSIPFTCRCGHGIDIPLSGLGTAVKCDKCGHVSDDVPASVAEYVGVCSRKLIWVLHDFGKLPRKIPRSKPSLNKDLLDACTVVVCSGTIAAYSNVANKQYQPATARSEHILDRIKELTVKAGVALHTLDLYLPLSRHSRQGEIRCGNYFASSYVEIPPSIARDLLEEFKLLALELKKRPGDEDFSLVWPEIRQGIAEIVDVPHAEIYHRIGEECFVGKSVDDGVCVGKGNPKPKRPATVNQRMAAELQKNPDLMSLTAKQWEEKFSCTAAAVKNTETWKKIIMPARAMEQAKRANKQHGN